MKYAFLFSILAVAIGMVAARHGPWTWPFFYPAISFGGVAAAYYFGTPALFGKQLDGRRSILGTLLLGPYMAFLAVVWHVMRRVSRESVTNALGDDLVLSRRLLGHELPEQVASVVDLTCEFTEPNTNWSIQSYLCYPMLDGSGPSSNEIRELATEILKMPKPVLIHCAQGHGRTGLVAAAVLLVSGEAETAGDAIAMVQAVRPGVELNSRQRAILEGVL